MRDKFLRILWSGCQSTFFASSLGSRRSLPAACLTKQRLFFSMQIRIQLSKTLSGFRIQEEKLNADPDPQPWYKKIMSTYPIGSVWRPGKRPSGRAVGSVRARSGHTWTTARSTASCAYSCQEYPCSRGDGQSKKLYLKKSIKTDLSKKWPGLI